MVRRKRPLTLEEVRRRNSVERIKHEKAPLSLLDELPRIAATPYEALPEPDVLRLQWLGLYHDKPRVGEFMLRVKLPGGLITPTQLRAVGQLSQRFGRDSGEITTRQDLQLHHIQLSALPEIFELLQDARLSSVGACGDVLRNITGCPVAGLDPGELFDVRPLVQRLSEKFHGLDLPRKHKWTVAACPDHCNAPEIHDVGLIAVCQDDQLGFALQIGGGMSTVPRIAQSLEVFVEQDAVEAVLGGILEIWRTDLTYRRSRGRSRFKFMVDDLGPEGIRERLEAHLGQRLPRLDQAPTPRGRTGHMGIATEQGGSQMLIGFPVQAGLLTGSQMLEVAALPLRDIRFTREQNLVLTGIAPTDQDSVISRMAAVDLDLDASPLWGNSIACTGNPHCNFAVGDTKPRLAQLVRHLVARFGKAVDALHIHLDGCPHACGQHWVGDIGIQGTTRTTEQGRLMAYDVLLRGGLGAEAAIGRPLIRKVPSAQLDATVERLLAAYLATGDQFETFQQFCVSQSDEALKQIAKENDDG